MVEAVVEYDYTAQEPDELTIRKGDVIREIIKKQGGWWEGTLRDKRGMFPDNFVSVIQKEKVTVRQKPNRIRQCRAVFSYHPAHDDELSLSVGDIIDIICEVEEGWWKGRLGNLEGVFPSNFVAELDANKSQSKNSSKEDLTSASDIEANSPNLPPKPTKIICQVKYPYNACNEDELTLHEGDLITLISKDGQDRGWWRGELRGRVGVFPDNFVVVLPAGTTDQNGPQPQMLPNKDKSLDQKPSNKTSHSLQNKSTDEVSPKPAKVASQRKSLEIKSDDHKAPPLPGKKPNVPKKSPSSASSSGVLALVKQKIVADKVDGAASSRAANPSPQPKPEEEDCDFDQLERNSILPDMRANRAKAPGRRPPSTTVYREVDNGLVNGNSDHAQPASLSETSNDEDESEKKPKAREWEKHKAPWVEELKLNQAKRSSSSTSPADNSRLKLTPTDKSVSPSSEADAKSPAPDKESSSPVDMTKSLSALSTKLKTPTSDVSSTSPTNVPLRVKPSPSQPITTTPVRPQSIHGVMVTNLSTTPPSNQSPSPASKPPVAEKVNMDAKLSAIGPRLSMEKKVEVVTAKQYQELVEKLAHMEVKMHQQFQEMQSTIDDLRGKLQLESDMRRMLQAELEKVAQCVTQV